MHRKYLNVLVGVALCEHSAQTLETAWALARSSGGRMTVLHVVQVPELPGVRAGGLEQLRRLESFARQARLRALEALLARTGLEGQVETVLRIGDPVEVMVDEARRRGADLLVVGRQHHFGMKRLLLGSAVHRLRRAAPCPVLTVRHEDAHRIHAPAASA